MHAATREHWATLEIWAWSLENPGQHWSTRAEPAPPADHSQAVAAVASELTRLEDLLRTTGPDAVVDYFGVPSASPHCSSG